MVYALVSKAGKKTSFAGSNPAIRKHLTVCKDVFFIGFIAQLVESFVYNEIVAGSSPAKPKKLLADMTKLVDVSTSEVIGLSCAGSSPAIRNKQAIMIKMLFLTVILFFAV